LRREDGRDSHQILCRNACIAQGKLEGSQTLAMLSYTFGEEDPLWDHVLAQFICLQKMSVFCSERKNLTQQFVNIV
jgi:hypothetical protein